MPDFTGENQPLVTEENIRYNEEKKILNVLLLAKIKADEEIKILEEDFQIPMEGERRKGKGVHMNEKKFSDIMKEDDTDYIDETISHRQP